MMELFPNGYDFKELSEKCTLHQDASDFYIHEHFFMKDKQLYTPRSSTREKVIWGLHSGGLGGHLSRGMTHAAAEERFYWPHM